jgi:molybdate-binding protein
VLGLCGVWRHFRVGGADSSSCSRLWGSWSRKGWWGCAYSRVINWRGSTSWHDSRLGVVLARHYVKTAYVGSMCGTLVARRGETDIAGVYVFTQRLATRRAPGPVAEAEGGVAMGLFERGLVPIAQRGNPREDVEDLLRSARFNRSSCTVTRALLDLMLEKTPLRLSRGACLDRVVRPRCQHRTAAAAAMALAGTDVDLRAQCAADLYGFIPIVGAVRPGGGEGARQGTTGRRRDSPRLAAGYWRWGGPGCEADS